MINILGLHFYVIYILSLVSFPLTYLFLPHYEIIMRATLAILLLNNLVLVVFFFPKIKINFYFALFFVFIFANFALGLLNNPLSHKSIFDTLFLFLFTAKILVFINILEDQVYYDKTIQFLKRYLVICIISAILGTGLFYLLPQNTDAYAGLTPVAIPYLLYGLLNGKFLVVALAMLIIFLSGKRAIMLSAILVTVASLFSSNRNDTGSLRRLTLLFSFALLSIVFVYYLSDSAAFQKIEATLNVVSNLDDDLLFRIVGPRFYEVTSIYNEMGPFDYILGKGSGFTYDLVVSGNVISPDHANAHFSPIGIVSKYGAIIFVFLTLLFLRALLSNQGDKYLLLFLKLYLISFLFESLFSYLIFNDKILPVVLALLLMRKPMKVNKGLQFV
jgi:hypothetical protein